MPHYLSKTLDTNVSGFGTLDQQRIYIIPSFLKKIFQKSSAYDEFLLFIFIFC